jgi:hypothetical protein
MIRTSNPSLTSCIQNGGSLAAGISCYVGKLGSRKLDFGDAFPLTINQASLQPAQAVSTLGERIKRIGRVNVEIADWLQV